MKKSRKNYGTGTQNSQKATAQVRKSYGTGTQKHG